MPAPDKTIYSATGGNFLRPSSVGSSIFWYVTVEEYERQYDKKKPPKKYLTFKSVARLSDCDDSIQWHLNGENDVQKIDRAIEQLQAIRDALAAGRAVYDKRRKQLKITDEDEFDD